MKHLRSIARFLIAILLMYLVAFWLLTRIPVGPYPAIYGLSDGLNLKGGNSWQKFQEFDPQQHYDLVFLGSSHAYRGYDPRIFAQAGYAAFNLGTSSQTFLNSYYICGSYLTAENCGLLVLDVFAASFELDGLESTSDLTQNMTSDAAAVKMGWAMRDPRALNMITLRAMMGGHPPFYLDSAYMGLGFSENWDTADTDLHYIKGRTAPVDERQWDHFIALLELCQQRGIPVLLVDHPAPKETWGEQGSELYQRIAEAARSFGITYFDLRKDPPLDSRKHFYDHTHLNQKGVERFDPVLIQLIEGKGLMRSKQRE